MSLLFGYITGKFPNFSRLTLQKAAEILFLSPSSGCFLHFCHVMTYVSFVFSPIESVSCWQPQPPSVGLIKTNSRTKEEGLLYQTASGAADMVSEGHSCRGLAAPLCHRWIYPPVKESKTPVWSERKWSVSGWPAALQISDWTCCSRRTWCIVCSEQLVQSGTMLSFRNELKGKAYTTTDPNTKSLNRFDLCSKLHRVFRN